jgi:lysophospholipase L1-like esterase
MALNVSGSNVGPNSSSMLELLPVQYNPDTNQLYVQGNPLPISLTATSAQQVSYPGLANVQQVMASPPTVAISTTNPVATGQQYVVAGAGVIDLSNFTITGAGNPVLAGTTSPDNGLVSFNSVTANNGTTQNGSNVVRVSIIYNSVQATPAIAFVLKGLTGNITAKVNDKYVSLTPTAVPNNGALNYYSLTFAAAGTYRIDVIIDNVLNSGRFGGCWTGSKTDTVYPAPIRGGKRIIFLGDSVTSATGGGNQSAGFVQCFAEYMGYDDVWPAGIGGTGLTNNGSGSLTYIQRVQQDVLAFNPDEIIIQGFYNDGSNTSVNVQTALLSLIQTIQQTLPNVRIFIFGPYAPTGVSFQGGTNAPSSIAFPGQRAALKNVVSMVNSSLVKLLDPTTLPFYSSSEIAENPASYNLTALSSANASSLSVSAGLTAGAHYQFADTSRFRCLSSTGTTATVENSPNSQVNLATFQQCGGSWLTGNGKAGATTGIGNADNYIIADGIHPSALGHLNLGIMLARLYEAALASGEG